MGVFEKNAADFQNGAGVLMDVDVIRVDDDFGRCVLQAGALVVDHSVPPVRDLAEPVLLGITPTMLWYLTHGGVGDWSITGNRGDSGDRESMLVLTVNSSVLRKRPGLSRTILVLVCTIMAGSLISLRPSQRV